MICLQILDVDKNKMFRWAFDCARADSSTTRFTLYERDVQQKLEDAFECADRSQQEQLRLHCCTLQDPSKTLSTQPPDSRCSDYSLRCSRDNFKARTTLIFNNERYVVFHTKKGWKQERIEYARIQCTPSRSRPSLCSVIRSQNILPPFPFLLCVLRRPSFAATPPLAGGQARG